MCADLEIGGPTAHPPLVVGRARASLRLSILADRTRRVSARGTMSALFDPAHRLKRLAGLCIIKELQRLHQASVFQRHGMRRVRELEGIPQDL